MARDLHLDPAVRELLVCPRCRGDLEDAPGQLVCGTCELAYPVVDGVPFLIPERARKLEAAPRGG